MKAPPWQHQRLPPYFHEAEDQKSSKLSHQFKRYTSPNLAIDSNSDYPLANLNSFLDIEQHPVVFCAESTGRETLMTVLSKHLNQKQAAKPVICQNWRG
ncbi:hypothetical protein THIOSC13_530003 [uncultured Thiomicrorhabdus sp.]